jgi:hypothetical protein
MIDDEQWAPLSCPKHGRLRWKHVTTQKSCGLCMEEIGDASRAPRLAVIEPEVSYTCPVHDLGYKETSSEPCSCGRGKS